MAYIKQNFVDGEALFAEQLNHMENGIASNAWTEEKKAEVVAQVIAELPVYGGEVV